MPERLQYEVDGPADEALEKAARRLERIGAADGEHVDIELVVAFGPPNSEVRAVNDTSLDTPDTGDASLSSFGTPAVEGETDGGVDVDTGTPDTTSSSDTAGSSSASSSSSGYSSGGRITEAERELAPVEPDSQYHEILTCLQDRGATSLDDAVSYEEIPYAKGSASPALSTLYRRRLVERDEGRRPYQYWVSPHGIAYLAENGRADDVERPGESDDQDTDDDGDRQEVGTVDRGGGGGA